LESGKAECLAATDLEDSVKKKEGESYFKLRIERRGSGELRFCGKMNGTEHS